MFKIIALHLALAAACTVCKIQVFSVKMAYAVMAQNKLQDRVRGSLIFSCSKA